MDKTLVGVILITCLLGFRGIIQVHSQEFDPFIQQQVDDLEYDSLLGRLQTFENLGIKQAGTTALDETAGWLIQQHQQFGYTDIAIDTFQYEGNEVFNLIVTKTGTTFPDTYLIIDGHYDTYNGPGVNDNGSGTAIVLEAARMLANVETAYSIKFIHFTAEELGLVGSTHYVENTVIPENMDIRLVLNIDEVGGVAGMVNNTITCERDEWPPVSNNAVSAAFTDTLANLTEMYSNLNTSISYAYGSDYVPFMSNGYVVTGLYEYNESPYPHSINDSLANMDPDYVFEILKGSLAAGLYFSGAADSGTGADARSAEKLHFPVYPNPFTESISISHSSGVTVYLEIIDINGRIILSQKIDHSTEKRIYPTFEPGLYFYRIYNEDHQMVESGKLIRVK